MSVITMKEHTAAGQALTKDGKNVDNYYLLTHLSTIRSQSSLRTIQL